MQEYYVLIYKCIVIYFVIVFALRIMGKREVGELSVFDIVIYLVMSELLAISISNPEEGILKSFVPIITLAILQIGVSWILLKSKFSRNIFDGQARILIFNGHLNQKAMKKERYNMDDLLSQMRDKGVSSFDDVAFAVLESSGTLSVLEKKTCKIKHPFPLVSDGKIDKGVLQDLKKDEKWLQEELQKLGIKDIDTIFLCMAQKDGLFIIRKEIASTDVIFH